jgi:hypothetical protein
MYELRHVVDLTAMSWDRFDVLLGYLGQLGRAIRAEVLSPATVTNDEDCFAHYDN